ncbi:MAG: YlbF family regulator [Clostridia bacterium]|nr:YlbF family regulator [Clostridia bacterium]
MFHMSREIYDKIEELGRLIADSEEFKAMRLARKASAEDAQSAVKLAEYAQLQQKLEGMMGQKDLDFDQIGEMTRELDEISTSLNAIPSYQAFQQARQEYDALMQGVIDALQNIVDPQIQCSCRGNCSECAGCGQEEE